MFKKYHFLWKSVFVFSLICLAYFWMFSANQINLKEVTPKEIISSNDLLTEFITNEKAANKKYVDNVIEVYGEIKEISFLNNRKTIILESTSDSGIICDINDREVELLNSLKKKQFIHIKGICKGYLKDVILLNCFISIKDEYE